MITSTIKIDTSFTSLALNKISSDSYKVPFPNFDASRIDLKPVRQLVMDLIDPTKKILKSFQ
jgi:hypothetical protein